MAYSSSKQYLQTKSLKLINQEAAEPTESSLFKGLLFYFNGHFGENELKLAISNGARTVNHYSAKVTHYFASELTKSKMIQLKAVPVLKAEWILKCIENRRLVSLHEFLLYESLDPKQKKLVMTTEKALTDLLEDESDQEDGEETREGHKTRPDLDLKSDSIKNLISSAPGFIQSYFSASRLHHLSNWKGELIALVSAKMKSSGKSARTGARCLLHVDMDAFFVSVSKKSRHDINGRSCVVAHGTGSTSSTAEIASCDYEAREKGIRNGMVLSEAFRLDPDIVVLPYDFAEIVECSRMLYHILTENSTYLKAVSCDEAIMEVERGEMVELKAERIRREIFEATGCTASVGIGFNILTCRLATHNAKPDGLFVIDELNVDSVLHDMSVSKLPGVGYKTVSKLESMGIRTCGEGRGIDISRMKSEFGNKLGSTLYSFFRGIDARILENKERVTVGCEINWAMRFERQEQIKTFVKELAIEVFDRMRKTGLVSEHMTVSAKKRNYPGEPSKFLGCGHCIDYSKSQVSKVVYQTSDQIFKDAYNLLIEFQISATELRGFGIHMKQKQALILESGQRVLVFPAPRPRSAAPIIEKKRKDFFQPRKVDPYKCFQVKYGVNPSQIAPSVLNEMPPDFIHDLEKARSHTRPGKEFSRAKTSQRELDETHLFPTFSQIDNDVFMQLPRSVRLEQKAQAKSRKRIRAEEPNVVADTTSLPMLGLITDGDLILDQLMAWTASAKMTNYPNPSDVNGVSLYLIALVDNLNMYQAKRIMRSLSVQLGATGSDFKRSVGWIQGHDTILERLQAHVKEKYGSRIHFS